MSDGGQQQRRRDEEFTLEDYFVHQHALRSLQHPQPVWLVDDILGLRYRACLQLCLTPTRRLRLTNDCGQPDEEHADVGSCSSPSLDIPLVRGCSIDVVVSPTNSGDSALRIMLPTTLLSIDAPRENEASPNAESSYFVVPVSPMPCTTTAALTHAWAAVLRSLCVPPRTMAINTAAAALAAHPTSSSSTEHHADPHAAGAAFLNAAAVAGNGRGRTTSRPLSDAACASPAEPEPTVSSQARATPTTTTSNLQQAAFVTTPVRTTQTSAAERSGGNYQISHDNDDEADCQAEQRSPRRGHSPEKPPPLHRVLPTTTNVTAVGNDSDEDERRLALLTVALHDGTREAAERAATLCRSFTPTRSSPSRSSHADIDADAAVSPYVQPDDMAPAEAVVVVGEVDLDRPPTMAHVSSGLVPSVQHSHLLPSIMSSNDDEDEDEEGEGELNAEEAQGGADANHPNGHTGSYANLADSSRPQAPRGGHVCNLGSIGPSCGDAEALRMYNEIHGSRSSSSRPSAAASTDSNASSFVSSAYEAEEAGHHHRSGGRGRGEARKAASTPP
ncbi:hypothetical protein ABB37_08478 [Leptomonas pyrrhocoris]|uniref:Uncharacterized protein n=1 Tax=Leptomonas pyrrhocoris TaxID=157538 RepID=A0A0M9FT93_LEPPY|nr:hypothetical protein ABB37_08478 [Leptomonas pyrrhocoris]KPA75605.1 hypothetical protein ABB37_08478 [Leptomonas pyrrhocoris]|eukprot:XP_015654044.1 hypothetical protein ABB37_08478 [Leptomonas pyrrhocoris]